MKGIYDLSCSLDLVSEKLAQLHILSKRKNTPLSKQLHLTFELSCSAFQRVELYFNIKRASIDANTDLRVLHVIIFHGVFMFMPTFA